MIAWKENLEMRKRVHEQTKEASWSIFFIEYGQLEKKKKTKGKKGRDAGTVGPMVGRSVRWSVGNQ